MSRYRFSLLLVFILAVLTAAGLYYLLQESLSASAVSSEVITEKVSDPSDGVRNYRFIRAARGPAVDYVSSMGMVEPERQTVITARKDGKLTEVIVSPGTRVGAGVPLARIEGSSDLRSKIAAHKPAVRLRRKEYLEAKSLYRRDRLTQEQFAGYLAEYENAMSQQEKLEAALEEYVVRSPVSGMILQQNANAGDKVSAGQELFKIGKPEPLKVRLFFSSAEISRIKKGQSSVIEASSAPGRLYRGKVDGIYRTNSEARSPYMVSIWLPPETGLDAGMEVRVDIIQEIEHDALLIPASGVLETAGGNEVFIGQQHTDGKYRIYRTPVIPGEAGRYTMEVTDGLMEGDIVLANPKSGLSEGSEIEGDMKDLRFDSAQEAVISGIFALPERQKPLLLQNSSGGGGCGAKSVACYADSPPGE